MARSLADINPLLYSKPVPVDQVIDREKEVELLGRLVEGNHNSRLSAPRRYGKTTLIKKIRQEAEKDGMATVYINFYGLLSVQEAAIRIEDAYRKSLHGDIRNFVVGAIRTLKPRANVPGIGVSISPDLDATEIGRRLTWLLDLPLKIMKKHGVRTVVVFDEFQEILRTKPPLDGLIRSVLEQHEDEASYIFAGSHPGMMAELFKDTSRPFYGQARGVVLPPLPDDALAEFIGKRFSDTGRDVGPALDLLLDVARGHPQRAMILAHFLWERTPANETADEVTWQEALQDTYFELKDEFVEVWNGLSDPERRTLAAVASGSDVFLAKEALEALQLARSTADDARDRLLKEGVLEGGEDRPHLVDPLLALWINNGRQGLAEPITASEEN